MDPILQSTRSAAASASAASQTGQAEAVNGGTTEEMTAQVYQQIFGIVLNLLMSQASEG